MSDAVTWSATERYERELAFHDERFAHGGGQRAADGFYVLNEACRRDYDAVLDATPAGARALEYGCGLTMDGMALAGRGVDVVAIDLSPVAVEAARSRAEAAHLRGITFEVMNAEALELPDDAFDLVCGSGILHHLDLDRAIDEVRRTLAPGGRAVFLEPMGHNPLIGLYRRLTPSMRTPDEHPLLVGDLERFRRAFATVQVRHHTLLALLALPLRRSRHLPAVLERLNRWDQALFRRIPWVARLSWTVVIEVADPSGAR